MTLGEGCEIVCVHVDVCFIGVCLVCDFACNRENDGKIKDITELNVNGDFCLRCYIILKILFIHFKKMIWGSGRLNICS